MIRDPSLRRLARTSAGWVELEIHELAPFGLNVEVTRYADDGWAPVPDGWWWERYGVCAEQPLATYLASKLEIPDAEAAELAETAIRGWREHGGEQASRDAAGWMRWSAIGMGSLTGLAVVGFGFVISFPIRWLLRNRGR